MTQFVVFAFYLTISAFFLVMIPVMLHPTLPMGRKALIIAVSFILIVPGGLALYATLGAPPMAAL